MIGGGPQVRYARRTAVTKADTTVERVGSYRVVRRLAIGGTSDVLLAKAEGPHGFERTVVLKVLLSQFHDDDELARMFAREASAYARLSHPAIVRLFDFFSVPVAPAAGAPAPSGDGQLVMVLEHVDGPALSRFRSMLKGAGKELDDRAAIYVASRIFDALAAAHSTTDDSGAPAPVIHRDVNPSNVLVPWDGQVKLADFGVAKVSGLNHQSVVGMIKGTYGYMAPEQVSGDTITPRADVYAGAIILWELLSKRRAFQRGALPEVEALRAMAEPRLVSIDAIRPDVDKAVRDALKRALEPRAERRTITAEEMVAVLSSVVPPDEGQEKLVSLLSLVRKDERVASEPLAAEKDASPIPSAVANGSAHTGSEPPQTLVGGPAPPATAPLQPRGMLPRSGPPRPAAGVGAAKATPREGPKAPGPAAAGGTANAKPDAPKAPSAMALPGTTTLQGFPAVSEPPKRPSAAQRLTATAVDTVKPTRPPNAAAIFDALQVPQRVNHNGETFRVGPRDEGELRLHDAIDEILRDTPSSLPAAFLKNPNSAPPSTLAMPPPALPGDAEVPAPVDTVRMLGEIPAAPPPMTSATTSAAIAHKPQVVVTKAAGANGTTEHELVALGDAPTIVPPVPVVQSPPTPRMVPLTRTLAMESRPANRGAEPAPPPPPLASSSPTPPISSTPTQSLPDAQASSPVTPATTPNEASSLESATVTSSSASERDVVPRKRRSGMGIVIAVGLVLVVAVGVAGSVGYLRYERARAHAAHPAAESSTPAAAVLTAREGPAATAPSATAAPVATPAPAVSASASSAESPAAPPAVSAAPAVSAEPVASTRVASSGSAPPAASAIAEGMGIVRTAGAKPNRRIFIDDRTVGQTPDSITIRCGEHSIRLGSAGKPQAIDVPCGGEISVGDKL